MARAGETPEAQFKQGSQDFGAATAANSLMGLISPVNEQPDYQPKGPEEDFLYSPTNRPTEPVTSGVSFGPGPHRVRGMYSSDDDVVRSVAQKMQSDPNVSADTKKWAERALAGD